MNILSLKLALCALSLAAAQPAMAQTSLSHNPWTRTNVDRFGQTDVQARLSFTIPFGDQSSDLKRKSKLSLGFRSETRPSIFASSHSADWVMRVPEVREMKFGLTLEDTPEFLMNDHVIFAPEMLQADTPKAEKGGALDTYDKTVLTVIGVSLAVIAGSIIIISD